MLSLWVSLGITFAKKVATMTPKPEIHPSKTSDQKPVRKLLKGATETGRLFVNVDEIIRRSQALRMTRYVE